MPLISENSPETPLPEYELFGLPFVQSTVDSTIQTEHRPISLLNAGGHIEFLIPTSKDEYILLSQTVLNVKLRVILSKTDKTDIVSNDWNNISIVNNFLNSLWQQVDVYVGDTQTTTSLQTHSIKSYIETLIGYSDDAKKSYLSSAGWFNDEIWDTPHKPNSLRSKYIKHVTPIEVQEDKDKEIGIGKIYDLYGQLHLNLALQNRALLGGTKLKIKLVPNPIEYYLITSDDKLIPKVEFMEITLNIMRSKVNQHIVDGHEEALKITPARYPFTRSDVRTTTINAGTINTTIENIINGQLPRRCFVFFTSNESFNGSFKKNPYYFHHYDVNYIACYLNSVQYPRRAYQPDFENGIYAREYIEFFRAADQLSTFPQITFSQAEYAKGRTIFGFNFSPDFSNGCGFENYISPAINGTMRIEIHFKKALTETINVLIYPEFDNLLMIPEDRNAILDYH